MPSSTCPSGPSGPGPPPSATAGSGRMSGHVAAGRYLGAFAGGRPAAGAAFHDMRQWWHGRPVPMAGVASVKVAPEYRGRGVGRAADDRPARRDRGAGLPAVGAVPGDDAAVPVAGLGTGRAPGTRWSSRPGRCSAWSRPTPPAGGRTRSPAAVLRRAGPGDADAVIAVLGRVHEAARDCGPVTWDAALGGRLAGRPGPVRVPRRGRLPRLPVAPRERRICSSSGPRRSRPRPPGRSGRSSARTPRSRRRSTPGPARPARSGGSPGSATRTSRTGPAGCSGWSTRPRPSPPAVSPPRPRSPSRCASPTTSARPTPAAGS